MNEVRVFGVVSLLASYTLATMKGSHVLRTRLGQIGTNYLKYRRIRGMLYRAGEGDTRVEANNRKDLEQAKTTERSDR